MFAIEIYVEALFQGDTGRAWALYSILTDEMKLVADEIRITSCS